jgi:predicted RNA binding protein YcfA (HicA-like mRNA interferase family)
MKRSSKLMIAARNQSDMLFSDLLFIAESAGFFLDRIKGSHHIMVCEGVDEILTLQPAGKNAKPYQVKQVISIIDRYHLKVK